MRNAPFYALLSLLFAASTCYAAPYAIVDVGAGGDADAASLGIGIGGTQALGKKIPLELSFFTAFTADDMPDDVLDYPVPHNDFSSLGNKNDGNEYGLLLKAGFAVLENLFVMGGAGASFQQVTELAQSNVTGWYYKESEETKAHFNWYGGMLYRAGSLVINAGYGNRRGVVGGIGFAW